MNRSRRDVNRYLAIVEWARRRYTHDGRLTISIGGEPSFYSRIEYAAFRRYVLA